MNGPGPLPPLLVPPFPRLAVRALQAELSAALAELAAPASLGALLAGAAEPPLRPSEELRQAVRALLRQQGYRPTGRGKPSSEYLAQAAAEGRLAAINPVVDAGNAVSLHSGLPISVVDLERVRPPLAVRVAGPGDRYVFNASGQEIEVAGLPCLWDREGPCANAVKDAQRTKTGPETRQVLAVVWGCTVPEPDRAGRAAAWLGEVLAALGAAVREVPAVSAG